MALSINLGNTGLKVNRMGLGGIPLQRLTLAQADEVLERAVAAGINFFDSARVYTDSESKMGRILSKHRQQVVLASKSLSRDAASMARDIDLSLRHFQSDYIDIYQCHNVASAADLEAVFAAAGAMEALSTAQKAGKIRFIGLSGHKPAMVLKALERYPFATIQIPFNHIETAACAEVIPYARAHNIGTIAMKPIGGGNISHIALNFRFMFTSGIDVAIPGMDRVEQIQENQGCLDNLAPLSASESAVLAAEKEKLGESFCRRCEYCMPCPQGLPIAFLHVLRNYYFLYELKDWVHERLAALPKTFKDCSGCGECIAKCPYHLDSPGIFKTTWDAITADNTH